MANKHSPKKGSADFGTAEHYHFEIEPMTQTKNLSRETLLTSFLQRASDLCSSGLQIDSEGFLYASGEMVAAWRGYGLGGTLFIDCGSSKVCNRRQVHTLKELAEKEGIVFIPYNEYSYPISPDFQFVSRMVSYPIWATPKVVNPKNIFQQALKTLDKAVDKAISLDSIHTLVQQTQHIASLFGFTFDASHYTTQATQGALNARIEKQLLAQHHLQQYTRITKELEAL